MHPRPAPVAVAVALAAAGCAAPRDPLVAVTTPSTAPVTWFVEPDIDEHGVYHEPDDWPWVEGNIDLGGREFRFVVRDARRPGNPDDLSRVHLAFDRDADGAFDADEDSGEGYPADRPFNLGTGSFRVASVEGGRVAFLPAWPGVAPRPYLGVGDPAPPLPARDLEGRPLSLEEFRGASVLLVFWAST
jgi:hypothetical protein